MSAELAPLAGIDRTGGLTEKRYLAGLEGFLHYFAIAIRACDEYLDIEPNNRE